MYYKILIYVSIVFHSAVSYSQKGKDTTKVSKHLLKLQLVSGIVAFEQRVSKTQTLDFEFFPSFYLYRYKSTDTYNGTVNIDNFAVMPNFQLDFRNYFNFARRQNVGRKNDFNSGPFGSFLLGYSGQSIYNSDANYKHYNDYFFVGFNLGYQKIYKNGLGFSFKLGSQINLINEENFNELVI